VGVSHGRVYLLFTHEHVASLELEMMSSKRDSKLAKASSKLAAAITQAQVGLISQCNEILDSPMRQSLSPSTDGKLNRRMTKV